MRKAVNTHQDRKSNQSDSEVVIKKPKFEEKDHITEHRRAYNSFKEEYDALDLEKEWDYETILQKMRDDPIKCMKYNYSLDADIQDNLQYDSLLTVSEDGKKLKLINKKPVEKEHFMLEADPNTVKKQQDLYK